MIYARLCVCVFLTTLCACSPRALRTGDGVETDRLERARRLTRETGVIDTHLDVPGRLRAHFEEIAGRASSGDFDYVRAREGGLRVPFMAIFIPSSMEGTGRAKGYADSLIDLVKKCADVWPDKFAMLESPRGVRHDDRLYLAMGMENGSALEGQLDNVKYFYARGIRYITLAHAKCNEICDASYDTLRRWNGLSPFGVQLVEEMNRTGMMIDVSHVSDSAFYQVIRTSRVPVIASHSSCRYFTPGFERNMSDDMIAALGKQGGVIQINFGSEFVNNSVRLEYDRNTAEVKVYLEEHHLARADTEGAAFVKRFRNEHPTRFATVAEVARHVDHAVKIAGIDHVGIGSDFDGLGDSLPLGLKDVSQYPNLVAELLTLGYSEADIAKICNGNILRVWAEVEAAAQEHATPH